MYKTEEGGIWHRCPYYCWERFSGADAWILEGFDEEGNQITEQCIPGEAIQSLVNGFGGDFRFSTRNQYEYTAKMVNSFSDIPPIEAGIRAAAAAYGKKAAE